VPFEGVFDASESDVSSPTSSEVLDAANTDLEIIVLISCELSTRPFVVGGGWLGGVTGRMGDDAEVGESHCSVPRLHRFPESMDDVLEFEIPSRPVDPVSDVVPDNFEPC